MPGTQRSRYRGIELVAETASPLTFFSVADTLGMNRPMQPDNISGNSEQHDLETSAEQHGDFPKFSRTGLASVARRPLSGFERKGCRR